MGPFDFKWTHGPSFGGLLERKRRLQASLDRLCDGDDSSLSIVFHLSTQAQDIQATGISAVGYAFVTGESWSCQICGKSFHSP